jgi:hypothetical protein
MLWQLHPPSLLLTLPLLFLFDLPMTSLLSPALSHHQLSRTSAAINQIPLGPLMGLALTTLSTTVKVPTRPVFKGACSVQALIMSVAAVPSRTPPMPLLLSSTRISSPMNRTCANSNRDPRKCCPRHLLRPAPLRLNHLSLSLLLCLLSLLLLLLPFHLVACHLPSRPLPTPPRLCPLPLLLCRLSHCPPNESIFFHARQIFFRPSGNTNASASSDAH